MLVFVAAYYGTIYTPFFLDGTLHSSSSYLKVVRFITSTSKTLQAHAWTCTPSFSLNFCSCKRGVRHVHVDEAISGKEVVYLLCVQHLMLVYLRQVYPCGYVPSVWAACALQAGKWRSLAMLCILVSIQLHLKDCDYIVVCCVVCCDAFERLRLHCHWFECI
jgi:hypothetical protein